MNVELIIVNMSIHVPTALIVELETIRDGQKERLQLQHITNWKVSTDVLNLKLI